MGFVRRVVDSEFTCYSEINILCFESFGGKKCNGDFLSERCAIISISEIISHTVIFLLFFKYVVWAINFP